MEKKTLVFEASLSIRAIGRCVGESWLILGRIASSLLARDLPLRLKAGSEGHTGEQRGGKRTE